MRDDEIGEKKNNLQAKCIRSRMQCQTKTNETPFHSNFHTIKVSSRKWDGENRRSIKHCNLKVILIYTNYFWFMVPSNAENCSPATAQIETSINAFFAFIKCNKWKYLEHALSKVAMLNANVVFVLPFASPLWSLHFAVHICSNVRNIHTDFQLYRAKIDSEMENMQFECVSVSESEMKQHAFHLNSCAP